MDCFTVSFENSFANVVYSDLVDPLIAVLKLFSSVELGLGSKEVVIELASNFTVALFITKDPVSNLNS